MHARTRRTLTAATVTLCAGALYLPVTMIVGGAEARAGEDCRPYLQRGRVLDYNLCASRNAKEGLDNTGAKVAKAVEKAQTAVCPSPKASAGRTSAAAKN